MYCWGGNAIWSPSFLLSSFPPSPCVCVYVCMMVIGLIFLWCRDPALPSHYFECRHGIVGGPLSDKWVLFLVSCESSSFKTIVLSWPISGDSRQTLTMWFALWSCRVPREGLWGEMAVLFSGGGTTRVLAGRRAVLRLCSQTSLPESSTASVCLCTCTVPMTSE